MRFREFFRFEVRYLLRQPSTWLYLGLLLLLGILRADSTDVGLVHYHAPVQAAGSMLMMGVLATLVTAGLFVEAGQRDPRWRMDPLFYTTPLHRWEYLGGRFLGVLLVNALLLLAIPAGLVLGPWLLGLSPKTLGPFRAEAYLLPYLVFLLPNLLVNAAVFFGVAVLSRRSLPGYLGALGLTVAYMYSVLSAGPGSSLAAALADPMGAVAMEDLTEGWTPVEQNARLVGLQGPLLWNRLLWLALGAGTLALTIWRFRFAHAEPGSRRGRTSGAAHGPAPGVAVLGGAVVVPSPPRSFDTGARARQTLEIARFGLRQTVLSLDFLLISLGLLAFALLMLLDGPMTGVLLWPLTPEVTKELTGWVVQTLIAMLTAFYAGELVWRERDAGIEKIGDSAPVPDWVPFLGKLLALALMLALLQALLMGSGVLAQALQGYYAFDLGLYLQILFGLQLADYLLFAVLALLVHALVNQKYVGNLLAVLLFVGLTQAGKLGIEHNLLIYGSDPGLVYSELNGFGPFLEGFLWFKLHWAAWALLLGVVALLFWMRGMEGGVRGRMRLARRRLSPRVVTGTVTAGLLVVVTGGFVFYNTNVLNEYRTTGEEQEIAAEYERRYKRFEHAQQPQLTGTWLHAELYPERREAAVRGTYTLVNRTGEPIDSVHLVSPAVPGITLRAIRFDRPARPVLDDATHGYRIYALDRALPPGDSLQLQFQIAVRPRGFQNQEQPSSNMMMVGDYTNLGNWLLPAIGYQRGPELSSPQARQAHGLPPTDVRPSIHDVRARQIPRMSRIRFEGTVGTSGDQIAVLPGTLLRSWTEDGRRYFHYRADAPILNFYSVLSAEYRVREAAWKDPRRHSGHPVEIRVLHHPDHDFNVDHLARSAQRSLDYLTEQFGPYPHRQLWLLEFPRYGAGAPRAYGGQMLYNESSALTLGKVDVGGGNQLDQPLAGTAHEVAHQWWGQQVMGADVQGSQMLSETLANYSAAMVLERTYGPEHARLFLQWMHEIYLIGRGSHQTPEAPLLLTTDHSYIHYGKGAVVMYALKDYLGEERVNTALRRLVQKHRFQGPPYATTLDLYRELQAVTPDSLQYLLEDLLTTITLWDLQTTGARAEPAGGGKYRVTLEVQAVKLRSDSVGNEKEVPMNDLVEVGVFPEAEAGDPLGKPLYLARHRIRSGRQTITFTVPGKPGRAGVDPYKKLITRTLEALGATNFVEVELEAGHHPSGAH